MHYSCELSVAQGHSAQVGPALLSRPTVEAFESPRQSGAARVARWWGGWRLIDGRDSARFAGKPYMRFGLLTATLELDRGDWEGGPNQWSTQDDGERRCRWRKPVRKWGGTPGLGPSAAKEEGAHEERSWPSYWQRVAWRWALTGEWQTTASWSELEVGGVEPELQKPGQKEHEVTEKLYAWGIDKWWPESVASRRWARWQLISWWGKMGWRRRKLRPSTSFGEGGGRDVTPQRSHTSVKTHRRQMGLAGTRWGKAVPYLGWLRALHGQFKPTRATVQLGRPQSFTQKLFHLFKLGLTCKLWNQTLLCSKIYLTFQDCSLNCNEQL
jgi:hypothetical protein